MADATRVLIWELLHQRPDRSTSYMLAAAARHELDVELDQAMANGKFTAVGRLVDERVLAIPRHG